MLVEIIPGIAVFTLAGLLYVEKEENERLKWFFKPFMSLLFVLVALMGDTELSYSRMIIAGLVLCWFGDVFLIPDSRGWFLAGLVVFLLGHVAYIAAFNGEVKFWNASIFPMLVILLCSGVIFFLLRPHLGDMVMPVLAYVIVISIMVTSAAAVYFERSEDDTFRLLVISGAVCFYISDLAVAIDRFVRPGFVNRLWGLPLYYLAQFLLAFSIYAV